MLQPRESRVPKDSSRKTMTRQCTRKVPHYWIYHKIPNNSRILVSLLGLLLLVLPNTFSQQAGLPYNLEPTPVLRLNNEDLTTVLLVKNDNRFGDHVHGRFLNVRPEVGLLTSTARTFIQEGVTTEYATQVVGATLENGRLYAQLLKKSSRVLYEPSVVTSWVGENLQSKSLLQSHNDLSNADQPDWQDIDDHLLLEKNAFVGNTDYVGINLETKLQKQRDGNGASPLNNLNITTVTSSSSSSSSSSNRNSQQAAPISEKARKIAANKVLPIGDLPTYTVKNVFAPSGYSWNDSNTGSRTDALASSDIDNTENEAEIQRSPKLYYNQIMGAQGRISQGVPSALKAHPENAYKAPANRVFLTTTYYGFADFTTIVGDSVIVFSPSTVALNPNYGHVTSIKGEATLSGGGKDNAHISSVPITLIKDLIEPTHVNQLSMHAIAATNVNENNLAQQTLTEDNVSDGGQNQEQTTQELGLTDEDSTTEEITTEEIVTVRPLVLKKVIDEAAIDVMHNVPAQLETSEVTLEETMVSSTLDINSNGATLESTAKTLLTRPSNEDILRIYASLASVEAARSSSSSAAAVDTKIDAEAITESIEKSSNNDNVVNEGTNSPAEAIQAVKSDIKILGGATTIFYEDDPFANFINPTIKSQISDATTVIEDTTSKSVIVQATTDTSSTTAAQPTTSAVEDTFTTVTATENVLDETSVTTKAANTAVETTTIEADTLQAQDTTSKSKEESTTTAINPANLSPTPKLAVVVKEIDEGNLDKIDADNCIRTSQVFLTQLPKTVTMYTTSLLTDEDSFVSTSIETNVIPTYVIEPATKHYCLQTQSANPNAVVQLEKPTTTTKTESTDKDTSSVANKNDNSQTMPISTTPMIIVRQNQEVIEDTTTSKSPTLAAQEDDEEETSTEVNDEEDAEDASTEDEFESKDDDKVEEDDAEEFDLIYKTLYTTYTYLTTFFHDDTTSISSHKEIVTNVITSTIGPENSGDIDATKLSTLLKDNEIAPTNTKFIVPTELESILRVEEDTEKSQSFVEATPILDNNKLTKTYYTTYTYYTTIFADGETEVMSRTEVYTNIVKDSITPTTITLSDQSSRIPQEKLVLDTLVNEDDNRVLEPIEDKVNAIGKLNTMQRSLENVPDLNDFSAITLVTDVRSSSSNGDHQIINNNRLNNAADTLEDQISSESNTDEIIPSATLLLQTSFTTFTYYTTMYSGDNTNIVSRLETVTNVVTETLQPTKVLNLEEANLPITYFTTFTYWTKLSKDGEITTLSREETVSNVVTPSIVGAVNDATIMSTQLNAADKDNISNAVVVPVVGTSAISAIEPTTYYTTYTYYTTSYINDQTITDSRFETITNVVQPSMSAMDSISIVSAEPSTVATNALPDSNVKSATLPITLSYDKKKIIDADGISTLFFTTQVIATTVEGGIPTETTSSSSSLQIDEVKKALLPTSVSSVLVNAEGSTVRQHKIGLVRLIEGTKIANQTTTLYQSKVIGTLIDNRYAQIIESTSSFLFEKTKVLPENEFNIAPTTVPKVAAVSPTIFKSTDVTQESINVSPDVVQGSISDNTEDHTDESPSDNEEEDGESDDSKNGLPFQSKKRTFTPVIRPFASRNRPQFAPKKKNGSSSSATIITRSDFTPTITVTPALKSSARFSSSRRGGFSNSASLQNNLSPSRRFSRPNKGQVSSNHPFAGGVTTSSSSAGFGAARNRLSSSRISQSSSSKRIASSIRPSSAAGFRAGFSSVYAGSSRLRLKPTTPVNSGQQSAVSDSPASENNSEEEGSTQGPIANDGSEEDETATENTRRNQNPLLRFRRPPVNRPAGFTPVGQRQNSSGSNSPISSRRNPLAARSKPTTVATTTTTTTKPRPRSFQRPTIGSFQSRTRPQNSLFPPRGLLQSQQQQVTQDLEENSETKKSKEDEDFNDGGDAEDESEYDDDEEEDGEEEGEDGANRRRRSNNKTPKGNNPPLKNLNQNLQNKKPSSSSNKSQKTSRVKREADTSFQTRSNFRNRFRRPKPAAAAEVRNNEEDIVEPEVSATTPQSPRPRTSSRFNSRYQNHNLHHSSTTTTASTPNHRAIRPTRPTTGRAQFTLREKDITTTSTQKGVTTRHGVGSFRRPQTAASSRRSTTPANNNRRLKSYSNNNAASENTSRGSNTRSRNGNISNSQRGRGTPTRGRNRNDYNSDAAMFGTFDGTITVTHLMPAEVTIPVVNGKVTEYKNVVTAKTSTEVLGPHQYSSFVGSNGQTSLALTREDSTVNFAGATEITQYVLHGSSTTTITFTPTTIRGRKTSFSHVIPSTVYSVENVVSTVHPQISANAPLANILLSQLLLGNIGLSNNQLLGALGGVSQPAQFAGAVQGNQIPATPVTEFRTHTSTYVTTLVEGMSTVIPVTFQGKKILTTIFDTTAQTITATEFITDTIVSTPTQQPAQSAQVNSLLLQQLLLQQQLQPHTDQQQLLQGLQAEQPAPLLLSDNLQELDTNNIRISNDAEEEPLAEEVQAHKSNTNGGRKKNRKSGKTHKKNKQQQVELAQEQSSVITLYVSGRRPGEFSTILSTVAAGYDSTLHKRQVAVHQTATIDGLEDLYTPDGSEIISEYVLPEAAAVDSLDSSARIHDNNAAQLERNMLELGENSGEQLQTQSLESIVGDVSLWYAKSTAQYEQQIQLKTKLKNKEEHVTTAATLSDLVANEATQSKHFLV